MIADIVHQVRAVLKQAPADNPPTLGEVAEASKLSERMARRALDALECLGEVKADHRYAKGRRGALPQVFILVPLPAAESPCISP